MLERITEFSIDRPWVVFGTIALITVAFLLMYPMIIIDTDPENMLERDQPDRVYYNQVKEDFGIDDMIVVGIVDEEGILEYQSLKGIYRAIEEIREIPGVNRQDVVSISTTRNIKSAGGAIQTFPVVTPGLFEQAPEPGLSEKLLEEIKDNPFLHEKIASDDAKALAIYVPIESKKVGYRVAHEIDAIMDKHLLGRQKHYLAGLPIAEETFGNEMFVQMAIVAPAAFMVIMLIVYILFRRLSFLIPVGLTAMLSVIWAMGLLIGTGNTVHIMSSMIPVFLMPIAILDSVHILSEFFDRFRESGKKRRALLDSMRQLYRPMFFTSLTSAVGFASLSMANIPPVRVFGLFVAFGIVVAWLLSITLIPAIINMIGEEKLREALVQKRAGKRSILDMILKPIGSLSFKRAAWVLTAGAVIFVIGLAGILLIQINDNPVRWFKEGHPIREADRLLNSRFSGTYMASLIVEGEKPDDIKKPEAARYISDLQAHLEKDETIGKTSSVIDIAKQVRYVFHGSDKGQRDRYYAVPQPSEFLEDARYELEEEYFYGENGEGEGGLESEAAEFAPDEAKVEEKALQLAMDAIGQYVFQFEAGGDPGDLDNFLVKSWDDEAGEDRWIKAHIWVQMKRGDNQIMQQVEDRLAAFMQDNPPPEGLRIRWSGLTYINKVWQDQMVTGMAYAVAGSFVVVFFLMMFEFRSLQLGLLSMAPLTLALLFSYGLMGWIGKDYDMPIAVCSALSLGLAVDFAIHFLQRYKEHYRETRDLAEVTNFMFCEPGRAIARNAIVVSVGFLPLVFSSLTPYVTVGFFFSLIMVVSTFTTLFILPAAMRYVAPRLALKVKHGKGNEPLEKQGMESGPRPRFRP